MLFSDLILSTGDIEKLDRLKSSSNYRDYMNGIADSPIFSKIVKNCVENVNISEDIDKIIKSGLSSTEVNTIFISSLKSILVRAVADTIIMKELCDITVDDVVNNLSDNFKVKYLLGDADEKYYQDAEKILNTKPDSNSLMYKGLMNFYKKSNKISKLEDITFKTEYTEEKTKPKEKTLKLESVNLSGSI